MYCFQGTSESEKQLLQSKWASRLSSEGLLVLQCGETRSQLRNKKLVMERFFALLEQNLKVAKP
ncbi:MAG: hypothetical protein R2793_02615 [Flavobacteriaceae bacterium]